MNYPSIKTLQQIPGVDEGQARRIRVILRLGQQNYSGPRLCSIRDAICAMSPAAAKYRQQCYGEPPRYLLKLYAINEIVGSYGVEAIDLPPGSFSNCQNPDICIEYLNTGDTYTTTLCRINRFGKVTYRVSDWGTVLERLERKSDREE